MTPLKPFISALSGWLGRAVLISYSKSVLRNIQLTTVLKADSCAGDGRWLGGLPFQGISNGAGDHRPAHAPIRHPAGPLWHWEDHMRGVQDVVPLSCQASGEQDHPPGGPYAVLAKLNWT